MLNTQKVVDFQVQGNQLNVVSAEIVQGGKGDTLNMNNSIIVEFNSIFDFRDHKKTILVDGEPIFENQTYNIVTENYNVSKGLSDVV